MITSAQSLPASRQWLLAGILVSLVGAILGLAYYWFIASDYAVLATGVRPEQAAAIVDQLKKDDVGYELKDGGTTVLVPASRVDAARIDIAGEELPIKGTVGFELFNQSDMGLTDFAQKVNYQRALQGEIARTIMALDGIAYARVHLAIPERSLFRSSSSEPRAAVTLTPKPGTEIEAARIAGIQRLVAAAVPDLAIDQVAVLNERGELLTPEFSDLPLSGETTGAVETNYRERILGAAQLAVPRAHLEAKVVLVPRADAVSASQPQPDDATGAPEVLRDQSVRVVIFERTLLSPAEEQAVRKAVEAELSLNLSAGDQLSFSPAPEMAAPLAPASQARQGSIATQVDSPDRFMARVVRGWEVGLSLLAGAALLFGGLSLKRRTSQRRLDLAQRIREQLLLGESSADAA